MLDGEIKKIEYIGSTGKHLKTYYGHTIDLENIKMASIKWEIVKKYGIYKLEIQQIAVG